VKSLIQKGVIGNVRMIDIKVLQPLVSPVITQTEDNWRVNPEISGGGLFFDLSPHQLDIMYWIFGVPEKVSGQSFNLSKSYDAPDVSMLQAVFKNGVALNGAWAFNVAPSATEDKCEIIGDQGKLIFSFFKKSNIEIITERSNEVEEAEYPANIQQHMIDAVTKYFRGEGPNPCSLEDALVVMKMMESTKV
jgi:1,5-anhydro-D-fructose reductase (1,5-anhydro-D-mannitol-forming)